MNQENDIRISKNDYFLAIAGLVSKRSTCIKRKVGSVLVKDSHILSTGYNGSPSGFKHCTSETCVRQNLKSGQKPELCRGVHAEINCIIQAAMHGTSIKGDTTLFTTHFPCMNCFGIKNLVYKEGYNMENKIKEELLKESKLNVTQLLE